MLAPLVHLMYQYIKTLLTLLGPMEFSIKFLVQLSKDFFIISFFETNSQPLSFIQRNEHVEINNFSCSLACTWMTIIDCLLYASGSLS